MWRPDALLPGFEARELAFAHDYDGALHDLVLSRREIRDEVFRQLFAWAERAAA